MASLTVVFGVLLTLLGVGTYSVTSPHAPTSLIPAVFGVLLILCGSLAKTEDTKKRMVWMHIAVTLGLVGFLIPTIRATVPFVHLLSGEAVVRPLAVWEQMGMAFL